jgi:hypothetical protein
VKAMKLVNSLAGAGIAIMFSTALAWGQTIVVTAPDASTTTTTTTTTMSDASPPYVVNPNDPVQFPNGGVGMANPSHEGAVKAAFVDKKIAEARAQGVDVSAAETQEIMGQADLRKGLNDEAGQHFDAALRSVGVSPRGPQP